MRYNYTCNATKKEEKRSFTSLRNVLTELTRTNTLIIHTAQLLLLGTDNILTFFVESHFYCMASIFHGNKN